MLHHRSDRHPATDVSAATRLFSPADQERFTLWSADRNPIHLASHAGRPGLPERPVVHGIHAVLWGLDVLFEAKHDLAMPETLRVRFEKRIHVGDEVCAVLAQHEPRKLRLNLMRGAERVASLHLGFEPPPPTAGPRGAATIAPGIAPRFMTFADIEGFAGRVPVAVGHRMMAGLFPATTRALGRERVAALVCTSVVVGMVCPGLHSLFAGLDLMASTGGEAEALQVATREADARFGRARLAVEGSGWTGLLDTLHQPRPET